MVPDQSQRVQRATIHSKQGIATRQALGSSTRQRYTFGARISEVSEATQAANQHIGCGAR